MLTNFGKTFIHFKWPSICISASLYKMPPPQKKKKKLVLAKSMDHFWKIGFPVWKGKTMFGPRSNENWSVRWNMWVLLGCWSAQAIYALWFTFTLLHFLLSIYFVSGPLCHSFFSCTTEKTIWINDEELGRHCGHLHHPLHWDLCLLEQRQS